MDEHTPIDVAKKIGAFSAARNSFSDRLPRRADHGVLCFDQSRHSLEKNLQPSAHLQHQVGLQSNPNQRKSNPGLDMNGGVNSVERIRGQSSRWIAADLNLEPGHLPFEDDPLHDGIFFPGSAYLELHSVLKEHILETARSTCSSGPTTPRSSTRIGQADDVDIPDIYEQMPCTLQPVQQVSSPRSSPLSELTPKQECMLWENWVNEVAPWVRRICRIMAV